MRQLSGDSVLLCWQAKDLFSERGGERLAGALVGEVEQQRRHRNAPRVYRPEVRAPRRLAFTSLDAHPVIGLAAGIEAVVDAQEIRRTLALGGHRYALHRMRLTVGEVHVEHHAFRPTSLKQLAQQIGAVAHWRVPDGLARLVVADGEAQRNRRHAEQTAFDGASYGAGIVHVV